MFRVGIITSSDLGYKGERVDESGALIKAIVEAKGYTVEKTVILPDEQELLSEEMKYMADELGVDLVLTTGGTGFSKRDITPEATKAVCDRDATGITEAMRYYSLSITKRAMLSRAYSGIRKSTLIVNLPGSPKAVKEELSYAIDSIEHGLEILTGKAKNCASEG